MKNQDLNKIIKDLESEKGKLEKLVIEKRLTNTE